MSTVVEIEAALSKLSTDELRRVTRLPAARLTPPDALLAQQGFKLRERRFFEWGLLHSDLWAAG